MFFFASGIGQQALLADSVVGIGQEALLTDSLVRIGQQAVFSRTLLYFFVVTCHMCCILLYSIVVTCHRLLYFVVMLMSRTQVVVMKVSQTVFLVNESVLTSTSVYKLV